MGFVLFKRQNEENMSNLLEACYATNSLFFYCDQPHAASFDYERNSFLNQNKTSNVCIGSQIYTAVPEFEILTTFKPP